MPAIQTSQTNFRLLTAMADERGTTPEAILDHILADIRINYAGIRHDDTPEEIEARIAKAERRAEAAKAARTPAQAQAGE